MGKGHNVPGAIFTTDGSDVHFMDSENYDQIHLSRDWVGDQILYLKENDDAKVTAWEASIIAGAPLIDRLNIFGRLGVYRATVKDVDSVFGTFEHDNNNFTFGLGLGYDITPHFTVRGEWQRYYQVGGGETALGAGVGQKSDVDVFGISALWRF